MLKIYVNFLFVHFSSKQLIFVRKHTLGTERLVTDDCIAIQISLFTFFSSVPSKMCNRKELSEDLKQTVVNLALKGYSLHKIGQLVNKTYSIVQYIGNNFKYTGSIKNEPRKPKKTQCWRRNICSK